MKANRSPNERLAILEQKVSHMDEELDRMSAKVDEMHAILRLAFMVGSRRSWRSSQASARRHRL